MHCAAGDQEPRQVDVKSERISACCTSAMPREGVALASTASRSPLECKHLVDGEPRHPVVFEETKLKVSGRRRDTRNKLAHEVTWTNHHKSEANCPKRAELHLAHASFVSRFQMLFVNFDEDRSSNKRIEICTFDVDDSKAIRLGLCLTLLHTWNTRTSASPMVESPKKSRVSCRTSPRDQQACFDCLAWTYHTFVHAHQFCGDDLASHLLACAAKSQFSCFQSLPSSCTAFDDTRGFNRAAFFRC